MTAHRSARSLCCGGCGQQRVLAAKQALGAQSPTARAAAHRPRADGGTGASVARYLGRRSSAPITYVARRRSGTPRGRRVASRAPATRLGRGSRGAKRTPFPNGSMAFWLAGSGLLPLARHAARRDVDEDAGHRGILAAVHGGGDEQRALRTRPAHARDAREARAAVPTRCIRSIASGRASAPCALGRYEGDVYFSGGAYYFSTLGAAEFCFHGGRAHSRQRRARRDGSRAATRSSKPFAPSRRRAAISPSSSINAPASKPPPSTSRGAMPRSSPSPARRAVLRT